MAHVYVAGPVVRQSIDWDVQPWVQKIYEGVDSEAREHRRSAMLPLAEVTLDKSEGGEFFHEIRRRIATSEVVVAVFEPGDVACAIETTIASVTGKRVLMISRTPREVPRLLKGLPGVRVLAEPEQVTGALADLLREPPRRETDGTSRAAGRSSPDRREERLVDP